jgi:predicted dehydrogenase
MSEPVRVGVVGCGSVSVKTYMPLLRRLALQGVAAEIVATCDVNPALAETVRERFGIERFTTDYREVVGASDVDLVLVLTSMQTHAEITRAALIAGKHVLVEKPMAMTLEEARALVELSHTAPGHLLCAPHVTLSPTYQAMWRHVHAGDIGRVLSARGMYGWAGPSWGEWFYLPGGGPMFDLGVYNVTTLTGLLGPAKRVMSMSGIAIPERIVDGKRIKVQTDDNAQLLLDFGDCSYAVVTTGFTIQRYRCAGIELYGTEGTLQMLGEDWAPTGHELWQNSRGCWQVFEDRSHWPWADGLRHMIESIHAGTAPVNRPEHAYHVLEIMLKSMESGRTGQAIPIESTFEPPRFDRAARAEAAHLIHDPGAEAVGAKTR